MEEKYCLAFGEVMAFRENFFRRVLEDTKSGKLVWGADIDKKQYSTTLTNVDDLGVNTRLVVSRAAVDSIEDFTENYKLIVAQKGEKVDGAAYSVDYDRNDRESARGEYIAKELWTAVMNGATA